MIDAASIAGYLGEAFERGLGYVYIPPHPMLASSIANYTITCPHLNGMPEDYTVLPTASATLCYAISGDGISGGLRGVNTRPEVVGASAHRAELLLLIEFHPGGLQPLIGAAQSDLLDRAFAFRDVDKTLDAEILAALLSSMDIADLITRLNAVFLKRLVCIPPDMQINNALALIRENCGGLSARQLSARLYLSERQLARVFKRQVGVGVKTFSRIVRVNHAMRLMNAGNTLAAIAANAGYFDQPHFIRDFRALCGVAPGAYLERMSVYYNDTYKL